MKRRLRAALLSQHTGGYGADAAEAIQSGRLYAVRASGRSAARDVCAAACVTVCAHGNPHRGPVHTSRCLGCANVRRSPKNMGSAALIPYTPHTGPIQRHTILHRAMDSTQKIVMRMGDLAEAIGVSKPHISKYANSGKCVRGHPVHEWATWMDGRIHHFKVPKGTFDDEAPDDAPTSEPEREAGETDVNHTDPGPVVRAHGPKARPQRSSGLWGTLVRLGGLVMVSAMAESGEAASSDGRSGTSSEEFRTDTTSTDTTDGSSTDGSSVEGSPDTARPRVEDLIERLTASAPIPDEWRAP